MTVTVMIPVHISYAASPQVSGSQKVEQHSGSYLSNRGVSHIRSSQIGSDSHPVPKPVVVVQPQHGVVLVFAVCGDGVVGAVGAVGAEVGCGVLLWVPTQT